MLVEVGVGDKRKWTRVPEGRRWPGERRWTKIKIKTTKLGRVKKTETGMVQIFIIVMHNTNFDKIEKCFTESWNLEREKGNVNNIRHLVGYKNDATEIAKMLTKFGKVEQCNNKIYEMLTRFCRVIKM